MVTDDILGAWGRFSLKSGAALRSFPSGATLPQRSAGNFFPTMHSFGTDLDKSAPYGIYIEALATPATSLDRLVNFTWDRKARHPTAAPFGPSAPPHPAPPPAPPLASSSCPAMAPPTAS